VKIEDRKFRVPISNDFKKERGEIWIPFPERINPDTLKEIRIHPRYQARFFDVEFITLAEETNLVRSFGSWYYCFHNAGEIEARTSHALALDYKAIICQNLTYIGFLMLIGAGSLTRTGEKLANLF
jgi:hypothetical protein